MEILEDKLGVVSGKAIESINKIRDKTGAAKADACSLDGSSPTPRPVISGPFGVGNTSNTSQPPPIGFMPGVLYASPQQPQPLAGSHESLDDGSTAWSKAWFQRLMLLSLVRLLVYIRKVYEDYQTTSSFSGSQIGHFLIAATSLIMPTAVFTIYRVTRYLQEALPKYRAQKLALDNANSYVPGSQLSPSTSTSGDKKTPSQTLGHNKLEQEADSKLNETDNEKTRQSFLEGSQPEPKKDIEEEDGLVTARQTPYDEELAPSSNKNDSHTILGQGQSVIPAIQIDSSREIIIKTSEQLLHGVLFLFWQFKRQIDVLSYLVERSCIWRTPKTEELKELETLKLSSDGLEWFQGFYAAFVAILVQVYTLGVHWTPENMQNKNSLTRDYKIETATNMIGGTSDLAQDGGKSNLLARNIGGTSLGSRLPNQDVVVYSQLMVSSLVIVSLLMAVKRRDDGILTLTLSMLGWGSMFAARVIIIGLAFVHVGWQLMLLFMALHLAAITAWIYKIALDSHNDKPGESDEHLWDNNCESAKTEPTNVTSDWSIMEHLTLLTQIFTLFSLPALFYWPVMFNLKLHYRPCKYLVLVLSENFILIAYIFWCISQTATIGQWNLLVAVGSFSISGFVFIVMYIVCKPKLTEYFARADELFEEAQQSGIYFEFCSRVFKLPDLTKESFKRLLKQKEDTKDQDEEI